MPQVTMLQPDQLVQSTVFVVDVTSKFRPSYLKKVPIRGKWLKRVRVREIYTYVYPVGRKEPSDPCKGQSKELFRRPIDDGKQQYYEVRREIELDYEVVGSGDIHIRGNEIVFKGAGIRCESRACGPAYTGSGDNVQFECNLLPSPVYLAIVALLGTSPTSDDEVFFLRQYLGMALGDCYETLLGELPPTEKQPVVTTDQSARLHYLHVHAMLPDSGCSTNYPDAEPQGFQLLADPPRPAQNAKVVPLTNYEAEIRPIFWYPFYDDEAFAVGALTNATHLRLFGRMGKLTPGYRVTDTVHWLLHPEHRINEMLLLTFAEDVDLISGSKYAEFDAGPLPPGDQNIELVGRAKVKLYGDGVPFYVGALPLTLPKKADTEASLIRQLNSSGNFCYLHGTLDSPIVFDPIVNCGGCAT